MEALLSLQSRVEAGVPTIGLLVSNPGDGEVPGGFEKCVARADQGKNSTVTEDAHTAADRHDEAIPRWPDARTGLFKKGPID